MTSAPFPLSAVADCGTQAARPNLEATRQRQRMAGEAPFPPRPAVELLHQWLASMARLPYHPSLAFIGFTDAWGMP